MSIEVKVYCADCGHETDEDNIICRCCYESLINEIDGLKQTIRELEELQSEE